MISLLDRIRRSYIRDACKHDLCENGETPEEFADAQLNQLSNVELLEAISDEFYEAVADIVYDILQRSGE